MIPAQINSETKRFTIHEGNALDLIGSLPLVHCVVTSPPYFQKRRYGQSALEIGQEDDIKEYINTLVTLFNNIKLHSTGSIWVNIGDKRDNGHLLMIPERFALAMCDSNWHLIDTVIWAKVEVEEDGSTIGGCMPEPAARRLNGNGYEYFYRFVRNVSEAWSDTSAVRIPRQENAPRKPYLPPSLMTTQTSLEGRNLPNVWRIAMGQSKKKHYAVFPNALCERPIAMTCPLQICASCGVPRKRITEMVPFDEQRSGKRVFGKKSDVGGNAEEMAIAQYREAAGRMDSGREYISRKPITKGWSDCKCGDPNYECGIVFDPFCGSGTTGEVSLKMGRSFVGIDLYPEFVAISKERCEKTVAYLIAEELDPVRWILDPTLIPTKKTKLKQKVKQQSQAFLDIYE